MYLWQSLRFIVSTCLYLGTLTFTILYFFPFPGILALKKRVSFQRKRWMRKGKYSNFRARPKILLSGGQGQPGRQCVHRELGGGKVGRGEVGEEEKEVTE